MVSQIKVNEIIKQSGSSITIGESGDTITLPSTATLSNFPSNTPYFQASITSNQSLTHDTTTKINFDRADVDSASGYDTTNKRYTIPSGQGGYWHIGYTLYMQTTGDNLWITAVYPYKNGSNFPSFNSRHQGAFYARMDGNPVREASPTKSFIGNLSAGDYIEIFGNGAHTSGGSSTITAGEYYSIFWGYKLIT
tara:strand:- start:221 stop:802 length:582 start_codon:yes stop_codon:yes gene_type:complete